MSAQMWVCSVPDGAIWKDCDCDAINIKYFLRSFAKSVFGMRVDDHIISNRRGIACSSSASSPVAMTIPTTFLRWPGRYDLSCLLSEVYQK